MVIADMLKNVPMFKKLDARIKVHESAHLFNRHSLTIQLFSLFISVVLIQGKSTSIGVGRGRGVGMHGRVNFYEKSTSIGVGRGRGVGMRGRVNFSD